MSAVLLLTAGTGPAEGLLLQDLREHFPTALLEAADAADLAGQADLAERVSSRVLQAPARLDDVARGLDGYFSGGPAPEVPLDLRLLHDAGAGDVDEVAFALATGVDYLRLLEEAGVSPADAFGQIDFRLNATADQFLTIAKLRALRRTWARERGFNFVGPTTCYAFMQSMGFVNDHIEGCSCRTACENERDAFARPR